MLRQQTAKPDGPPQPVPGRLRGARPGTTSAGSRSPSTAPRSWPREYEAEHDDYHAIMVKALADRLAEAFAEYIHLQARRDWYEPGRRAGARQTCTPNGSAASGPRSATRPAPDHSLKQELFDLLDAEQFGMALTESFAMTPAASVSGLIFAHPASRYFTVGRIGRDQVEDYAGRRGDAGRARSSAGCAPTWPTSPAAEVR